MSEDEFQLRIGRIHSKPSGGRRTFVGEALAAAQRAGGLVMRRTPRGGAYGRGRAASLRAQQGLGPRTRGAVVKARVVRGGGGRAPLALHLDYLQRDGVTQEKARGELFDAAGDEADGGRFAERCEGDRHHFRFIVSPDDAEQLSDLRAYTRDLMRQAERDLGTTLDWVAVDHWNTGHPHVHILVRGRTDQGQDLVISRDYIGQGLRARAGHLVTLELGPRTDAELTRQLQQQVTADRWTPLDRRWVGMIGEDGLIDLRRAEDHTPDTLHAARIGRMRKLQALGLAEEPRTGRWRLDADAEQALRELGHRQDVIARIHRALAASGVERDTATYRREGGEGPIVGRLVGRGLDDELSGRGYAVIDGVDGRTHHVRLGDLERATDAPLGAIVEVGDIQPGRGRPLTVLRVRSDHTLAQQVTADGATWLDRQLVAREPTPLGAGGFAEDVRAALRARADHLAGQGLAQRDGRRVIFVRDLLQTLRDRELTSAAARLARETGLEAKTPGRDGAVAGIYRQRVSLASGRFAMIDTGLGFSLVPWRPELERHLGRHVEALPRPGGGIAWSFTTKRGLAP